MVPPRNNGLLRISGASIRLFHRGEVGALVITGAGDAFSAEASMNYTGAKEVELHAAQQIGWKDEGVGDFVK